MRVRNLYRQASVRSLLLAIVIVLMTCWSGGQATAQQSLPTPTPEVANLPAGAEVVTSAELDLAAGDYQWHVTSLMTSNPGDPSLTVHQGVLFADTDAVLVSHDGAALDQVEVGTALILEEGEKILPIGMTGGSVGLMLVELVPVVAPATPEPSETPGYQSLMELDQGPIVLALIYLPSSDQNDAAIETIVASAAAPITEATRADEAATPEIANRERWIVALFAPSEGGTSTELKTPDTHTEATAPMARSVKGTPTPTTTQTPALTPKTTATTTPTATATATIEPTLPPITFETPSPTPGGLGGSDTLEIDNDPPSLAELSTDTDGDGLGDIGEKDAGSNPNLKDTDGDGLEDGPEVDNRCSPLKPDTDDDGVPDDGEVLLYKTKCDDLDTDNDSLFDYDEIFVHFSDPRLADTDSDGLNDYDEIINYDTGVRVPDSDGDGWNDGYEVNTAGTNPALKDSDYDCLSDPYETSIGTNPAAADTDGDLAQDGLELSLGIDPLDPGSNNGGSIAYSCDGTTVSR